MLKKAALLSIAIITTTGLYIPTKTMKTETSTEINRSEQSDSKSIFSNLVNWVKEPFSDQINALKNIRTWGTRAIYAGLGYLGYRIVVKPTSKFIFGKKVKPYHNIVEKGIAAGAIIGGIAGATYLFKYGYQAGIINKIEESKNYILKKVSSWIDELKERFDQTDEKIEEVKKQGETTHEMLSDVQKTTKKNTDLLKRLMKTKQ